MMKLSRADLEKCVRYLYAQGGSAVGSVPVETFDADHAPTGLIVRQALVREGLIEEWKGWLKPTPHAVHLYPPKETA